MSDVIRSTMDKLSDIKSLNTQIADCDTKLEKLNKILFPNYSGEVVFMRAAGLPGEKFMVSNTMLNEMVQLLKAECTSRKSTLLTQCDLLLK